MLHFDVAHKLNSDIELHDSVVADVSRSDVTVEIALRPAYVHQSSGQPGIDDGIVLVQDLVVAVENGSVVGDIGDLPADIWDGDLKVGSQVFDNSIPLPCDMAGPVALTLFLSPDNRRLVISGKRVTVTLLGESSYVEEFRRHLPN